MSAVVAIPFRHGTLDTPLRRAAMVQGDKVGLIDGERQFTYAELADRVGRIRTGLRALGTSSGDRIAGLALNSFRHFEAWMAIPTANLIFNDLNFRLALAELEFIVNDSEASVLFADARQWETATALRDRCPSLRQLVWMDDGDSPDGSPTWDELAAHDWSTPPP